MLHIRVGNLRFKSWLGVVTRLAVPLLLPTTFTDRFFKGIFTQTRKVVPFHSHPVAIVDSLEQPIGVPALNFEDNAGKEREERCYIVRVEKEKHIAPK